jgi:hypothetical protein
LISLLFFDDNRPCPSYFFFLLRIQLCLSPIHTLCQSIKKSQCVNCHRSRVPFPCPRRQHFFRFRLCLLRYVFPRQLPLPDLNACFQSDQFSFHHDHCAVCDGRQFCVGWWFGYPVDFGLHFGMNDAQSLHRT